MVGRQLGHYRVLEKLGAGGMGVVYRARDEQLQRDVALKVLPDDALSDEAARGRLLSEARSASALNHPHICTIYEVGEAEGRAYIAMELVEGSPLSALIPADGLPPETAVRYGSQLADALAHAHERGILHRDLKSANLMVRPDGRVKVLDFGLAARLDAEQALETTRTQVSLAAPGVVVGTLHYMAPEVLRGEPATLRSDIWAMGVMINEMVAGELPFSGSTAFDVSAGILRSPPAPLPADLPAGLRATIQRCLAKDPADRFQTAAEVRAALETLLAEQKIAPRARPSRKMLYQVRSELRSKVKILALPLLAILGFAGAMSGMYLATGLQHARNWILGIITGAISSVSFVMILVFFLKRWSFVVYPDKIRVKSKRRSVDIPFEQIEAVEIVSYEKKWYSLASDWQELKLAADPRYRKLGEAQTLIIGGRRQLIKVKCSGLGRQQGYYLDMDKADRFLETLNGALERYRLRQKTSTPQPVS